MIRKYKEDEIPELISIWEMSAAIAHPFLDDDFNAKVKKAMTEIYLPDSDTWVYEVSGRVVGFISMVNNEIGGLFVHPDYHSKGIGTSLVHHMSQFHETLEVEVFDKNGLGKPFYQKHNFSVIKTYVQEDTNQKVLRMKRDKT
ncbi:GNAT family N-acetyltransferase [Fulvivirgaceae bacterium BMA12]|uniref:GNAT family N-acetyltransferase n=1 Tax=Agaribacillus aureus TaxID=3051825 RepID=A0ABT8L6V2_9BACT|nr:GNAT family N-acetyltransferase [Fulvivirgaceae bacterium BMA12]